MSAKHTPAPWKYQVIKNKIIVKIKENLSLTIGNIYEDDCNCPSCCKVEEHANAKLIAAAPELLEALQEYVNNEERGIRYANKYGIPHQVSEKYRLAKAAIKKATDDNS